MTQTTVSYSTYARTLEELREEFKSEIGRRLRALERRRTLSHPGVQESSRITAVQRELEDLLDFWSAVELRGSRKPKEPTDD